jgi:hypothetical protein
MRPRAGIAAIKRSLAMSLRLVAQPRCACSLRLGVSKQCSSRPQLTVTDADCQHARRTIYDPHRQIGAAEPTLQLSRVAGDFDPGDAAGIAGCTGIKHPRSTLDEEREESLVLAPRPPRSGARAMRACSALPSRDPAASAGSATASSSR